MLPLANYICKQPLMWDGHIHLFNHESSIKKPENFSKYVGFMDIEFDKLKKMNVLDSYKRYIENDYNEDTDILLATGVTIEDIKKVYNAYPKVIKGFGELKCYDTYRGEKVPYKKISFVKQVAKFSEENGCLPVYVHWDFNNIKDVDKFEKLLVDYPSIPIILCHCGMNGNNNDYAFMESSRLQKMYSNLWLDISWDAAEYFGNNIMLLNNLMLDRIILGTDINPRIIKLVDIDRSVSWCTHMFMKLKKYLIINNLPKLFNQM